MKRTTVYFDPLILKKAKQFCLNRGIRSVSKLINVLIHDHLKNKEENKE